MRQNMMGFGDGSGISWTIFKQSAPRSRQITTPAPHLSHIQEIKCRKTHKIPKYDSMTVNELAAIETTFTMLFHQHFQLFAQNNWTEVREAQRVFNDVQTATKPQT